MIKISNLLNFYIYLFIHKKADVFFAKRFNFVEITLDKNQLIAIVCDKNESTDIRSSCGRLDML